MRPFWPCWGNVKDLISLRIAKILGSKMVQVKRLMPSLSGISREMPTGRAVGCYPLWHNFSSVRKTFYAMDTLLSILLYFPCRFSLDSVNGWIRASAVSYVDRKEDWL